MSFLGKFNLSSSSPSLGTLDKKHQSSNGFTLIELLIVIIMLAVLTTLALVTLNPIAQIQKGQDAQRQQDLKEINSALDTYYNDNNCYPISLPPSGSSWTSSGGQTLYMQKVPGDPLAAGGGQNYAYLTDGTACPQWNVLFAKVSNTSSYNKNPTADQKATLCPLANMKNSSGNECVPANYPAYNYCVLSGSVACDTVGGLSAAPITVSSNPPGNSGGGTPGGGTPGGGTPPSSCLCANTVSHAFSGQACQGGGWADPGFDHSIYNFYCNNNTYACSNPQGCCGGTSNQAATCP